MFLASTLDPNVVQLGGAIGFVLFLYVLPAAIVVFLVAGFRLIFQCTTKRIAIFLLSGLVSAALLFPLVLIFRGKLTSRSFGGSTHEFTSPDQVWEARFPEACKVKSESLNIGIGEALKTIYSVDTGSSIYAVVTIKYPLELIKKSGIPFTLDKGKDAVLATAGGALRTERDVYLNGLTGKEISFYLEREKLYRISRMFIKDDTWYSVSAFSSKDQDPDSYRFLTSFSFK